jgi:hypothetical protein
MEEIMSKNDRCMHGMLKGQCGICKKWEARSLIKQENAGSSSNAEVKKTKA